MNLIHGAILLASYLIGSIPFGVLVARMKGVDITQVGSGNIGATNVYRALGAGAGMLVLMLDVAKGTAPVLLGAAVLGSREWGLAAGVAAIAGHSASVFLRFRGGKGVATGLGVLLGFAPIVGACALGIFIATLTLTRYVSLASILAAVSLGPVAAVTGEPTPMLAILCILGLFVVYRHRSNLQRLRSNTEPRFGEKVLPKADVSTEAPTEPS